MGIIRFTDMSTTGCDSIAMVDIRFSDVAIGGPLDTLICAMTDITIDGVTISTEGLTEVPFAGLSSAGCDSTTQVNVSWFTPEVGQLDTFICPGASFTKGVTVFDENNLMATALILDATAMGCDSLLEVTVNIMANIDSTLNRTLCQGETIIINGITYGEDRLMDTQLLPSSTGCDTTLSIFIDLVIPDQSSMVLSLCPGDSETINGTTFDADNTSGTVTFMDSNGCDSLLMDVQVDFIMPPATTIVSVTETDQNSFLYAIESVSTVSLVTWTSDAATLSCVDCQETNVVVTEDTTLELNYEVEGCLFSESFVLIFDSTEPDTTLNIYEPSIFSPSMTGEDIFYVQSSADAVIRSMRIYDRWGNLVFEVMDFPSNDPAFGWDGRYGGREAEQGVYVYQLTYEEGGVVRQLARSLTLLR